MRIFSSVKSYRKEKKKSTIIHPQGAIIWVHWEME